MFKDNSAIQLTAPPLDKESIHWIVPTLSGILIGFGLLSIFLQALNYLVDAYLMVRLLSARCAIQAIANLNVLVRCFCYCCKHFSTFALWCRLSTLRTTNVSRDGHSICFHFARLYSSRARASASLVPAEGC